MGVPRPARRIETDPPEKVRNCLSSGVLTSLRPLFAKIRVSECNRDFNDNNRLECSISVLIRF